MPPAASTLDAASSAHELTDWGARLEPAGLALGHWASASPSFPRYAEKGPDSRTSLDPLTIDRPVRKAAMAERKALGLDRKSLPIRIASFEC